MTATRRKLAGTPRKRAAAALAVFCVPVCSMAADYANVHIRGTITGEPTWRNYGSTFTDANGNVQTLNMPVPFFHTVEINTTVLVSLHRISNVTLQMAAANENRNSGLIVASAGGDLDAARNLVAARALVNSKNSYGSTALMAAAAGGHDDIVRLLLARGARVNDRNRQGYTALMLAAAGGHAGTAKLLLENRACVDTMDSGRNTALMYAIAGGRNEAAKILIEKGARFDYISRLGFSPLDLAAHEKNEELISLMTRTASAPGGS